MRVLDGKNVILPAHPVGRFQDLFGFIPKIKGKNPVILTAARVRVRLPARQEQELLFHIFIAVEPRVLSQELLCQSFPKGAERDE